MIKFNGMGKSENHNIFFFDIFISFSPSLERGQNSKYKYTATCMNAEWQKMHTNITTRKRDGWKKKKHIAKTTN